MPNDRQVVSAQVILQALMDLRRRGNNHVMEQLEKIEPDIAEYVMETLSLIHQNLPLAAESPRAQRKLQRQIESLCLVCITAVRKGHFELWKQTNLGNELARRDPSLAESDIPETPGSSATKSPTE